MSSSFVSTSAVNMSAECFILCETKYSLWHYINLASNSVMF